MKKLCVALLLLTAPLACEKTEFEIDPGKVYTPSELGAKMGKTKCNRTYLWEDKTVSVVGYISQIQLHPPQDGGKFWLHDGETREVVEVYVKGASAEEVTAIYDLLQNNFKITVTGKAVASYMHTQIACKKGMHLEINKPENLQP